MMSEIELLKSLSSYMAFEPAEDYGCTKLSAKQQDAVTVSDACLPSGKKISLLKTLLTSACERNCYYCPFRVGRDFRRATLNPSEMANTVMAFYRAGIVQGLFLSSGVAGGGVATQDRLIETAEILRHRLNFNGYLHLKLMPGAERDQVLRAMELADRVSLNLEAPNRERLVKLAPRKAFTEELLQPLRWVDHIRRTQIPINSWKRKWPSMTTQFVVGAVGDSDLELLSTTDYLHKTLKLSRAYFSAFNPVVDTPLENNPPTSPTRQRRLYQASFLLRDYHFTLEELPFEETGDLPRDIDPKAAWANTYLKNAPVEVNLADRDQLLRIPGIGPRGVHAILSARYKGKICLTEDLKKIGINPTRALPYILLDGKRPEYQTAFW